MLVDTARKSGPETAVESSPPSPVSSISRVSLPDEYSNRHPEKKSRQVEREEIAPSRSRGRSWFRPVSQLPLTWTGALGAVALFVLTVLYAMTGSLGNGAGWSHDSQSNALLLLRLLSEGTGLLFAATISSSLERLHWMLVTRRSGAGLPTLLSLQSGTGVLGMLALLFSRVHGWSFRFWSLTRLLLKLAIPALAVLIMSQVTVERQLNRRETFNVAAGLGEFDPSMAKGFSLISGIYFATDFTGFLLNPQRAVSMTAVEFVATPCSMNETTKHLKACAASYFIPGGLDLISPWPSKNEDDWDADTYLVDNARGYHLDFNQLSADAKFDGTSDCRVFGSTDAAFQLCISEQNNTINAKMVHCPLDIAASSACETDTSWHTSSGWGTAMRSFVRKADVAYSRSNGTIMSIQQNSLTPPVPAYVSAKDLLQVFVASFNSTGIGSGTGAAEQFVRYVSTVLTFAETSSFSYNAAGMYFRNMLALPLYYFNANNLSPSLEPSPDKPAAGLPSELYTTASLAKTSYRIVLGRATVIAYIAIGGAVLLCCLTVLVLGSLPITAGRCPDVTKWPTVDFVTHCEADDVANPARDGLVARLKGSKENIDVRVVLDERPEGPRNRGLV